MTSPQTVQLRLVATLNPNVSDAKFLSDALVDFIPMSAIDADTSITHAKESRPYKEVKKGYTSFADGDVLLAKITPCFENGKISQVSVGTSIGFGSTEFHVIRPHFDKLDERYLVHFLRQDKIRADGERRMTGSAGQRRVPRSFLEGLEIPLPPLHEQRRIAAILDKADALRAKRREALTNLDRLPQSIFAEMFGDPVLDSKLWEFHALSEVSLQINDCPHSTPAWTDSGVICLRTSNLGAGDWIWDDTRFVSDATYHDRSRRGYIEEGDIILSREGTVGIAAIVEPTMKVCMGQRLVQVRADPTKLRPAYLLRHLLHVLAPTRISQLMVGSTAQHLNVKELRALRIPVPPIDAQRAFEERIDYLGRLRRDCISAYDDSRALFASLQHRAFHGQL